VKSVCVFCKRIFVNSYEPIKYFQLIYDENDLIPVVLVMSVYDCCAGSTKNCYDPM